MPEYLRLWNVLGATAKIYSKFFNWCTVPSNGYTIFLSLAAKSSSAYEDIRYNANSFLVLPSLRRLNYIHPQRGFNKHIVNELKSKNTDFNDAEKFVVLLLDETKVQHTVPSGYVDLGDPAVNYATMRKLIQSQLIFLFQ